MKHLFIDLDETLVHSLPMTTGRKPAKGRFLIELLEPHERYESKVRPGAHLLLEALRSMSKDSRLTLLTAAVMEYAVKHNELFDLGFIGEDICSREDIAHGSGGWLPKEGRCFLIDNLPVDSQSSRKKINFLEKIGPVTYIHIEPYEGETRQDLTPDKIRDIILKIK